MGSLRLLADYITNAKLDTFKLSEFIDGFKADQGLRRSVDKVYEVVVYALFATLVRHLNATVTVRASTDMFLLKEFEDFTKIVLGLTPEKNEITVPVKFYRVGVANAADRGLDMWANFGPIVQIKHLCLSEDIAEDIVDQVAADRIIIVCRIAEKKVIERLLTQIGLSNRIQGIITQDDLEIWYSKCFSEKYQTTLGISLLKDLYGEFLCEFPSTGDALFNFLKERGYDKIQMKGIFIS